MATSPTALGISPRRGSWLAGLDRWAWQIPLATRSLFVALAAATAALLVIGGLLGAGVLARSASTVDDARTSGVGVAQTATEFRTQLAVADAQAAVSLISGGLEEPEDRAVYDRAILDASTALTVAATIGRDDDTADILKLSEQLVRFNGSVETSRANARQGFPVGSAYLSQARELARAEMVPRADRLRRDGERRIAEAANETGGILPASGLLALGLATAGLLAAEAIVAGRTRRLVHPLLAAATLVMIVALVVMTTSVTKQRTELRSAATTELNAFVAANDASSSLSSLRVTEIDAVAARGSGAVLYEQFGQSAAELSGRLEEDATADLLGDIQRYVTEVGAVRDTDLGGDNQAAAQVTLNGGSATAYADARASAAREVATAQGRLTARVDAAAGAGAEPAVLILLGVLAAALAAGGILTRARRYR